MSDALPDRLELLQRWYRSNCNTEWEHTYGVHIETLDNPGWSLDVDLVGTPLADAPFAKVAVDRSETDWLFCEVKDRVFQGSGGPENLAELIDCFLAWQQAHAPGQR